jgi:spore coat protein CotF
VQELYQYFMDKSSSADSGISSVASQLLDTSSTTDSTSSTLMSTGEVEEFDFDSLEEQLQEEAESQVVVPF